ncbi:D,D-heptose 1,7-bisphosphate phosphatase [Advenella kashmirensis W13003]|uniref:D,D-heptose 1,7-bisphosphate phosphatase n=1 Tax=Advenella kashmirensis W13003 TaxID=1424334 RepID=V8QPR3_9BURK|nr:D-glycero-beta-D-manno-heptose 1,7-bisphosphate 7-phosphatase [Advenella kashmirensis]ETF01328.1 D,D-heptose 1,7-bisphosphate phosphatase [Advenella kashmirensis W13003]
MKLAILDRDGVINQDSPDFIKCADEWIPLPGSLEAIARLCRAGWKVVVATNQSGLGRGLFTPDDLTAIHQKMQQQLGQLGGHIDAIFMCPHLPDDGCTCRKPLPGMFTEILKRYDVPAHEVFSVGDSLRDITAAQAAGCRTWLVETGNGQKTRKDPGLPESVSIRPTLADVVESWLTES